MAIIDFKSLFSKKAAKEEVPMPASVADIIAQFKEADFKHSVQHSDGNWIITAGVSGKQNSYEILFVVTDEDPEDLTIRVLGLARCPEAKYPAAYKLLNELNAQYRFLKFCLGSNGNINIEADIPTENNAHGAVAVEFFLRIMFLTDDIYPKIMRLIWA